MRNMAPGEWATKAHKLFFSVVANGKGVCQESLHSGGVSKGAVGNVYTVDNKFNFFKKNFECP